LGGVFSTFQYAFILSIFFLFFNGPNFTGFTISEEKKEDSKLYGPIASIAPMVLPQIIEKFHALKQDKSNETDESSLK
jgi:membrane protein required for colicin V production